MSVILRVGRVGLIGRSLPTVTVTATTLVDAEPISSPPADLPTPIPGYYTTPLQNATSISRECVQNPREMHTWDCTSGALMELSINVLDSDPVVLFNFPDNDGPLDPTLSTVRYGAQPPILDGYTTMSLMNAKDHMEKGPAYVFHKQFDKLVILPEETFDDTILWRQRRDAVYSQNYNFSEAVYAGAGEKPWFCYWNGTLLEGFIFVYQVIKTHDTVAKRADSNLGFDGYSTTADYEFDPSSSTVSSFQTPATYLQASSSPVNPLSGPSSTTGASAIAASSTAIPAPPNISVVYSARTRQSASSASAVSASEASVSSTTTGLAAVANGRILDQEPPGDSVPSYDRYPTVIKIEERRDLENQVQPYCQQMLIMEDGSVQSIDQRRINLTVEEFGEIQSRRLKKRGDSSKRESSNLEKQEDDYGCLCEWILDGP